MENYIYSNIKYFCKKIGLNVRDFEAPLKPGYMSRWEKRGRSMDMPIMVLYKASKCFGVSMEDIIEKNLADEGKIEELRKEIASLEVKIRELERKGSGGNNERVR